MHLAIKLGVYKIQTSWICKDRMHEPFRKQKKSGKCSCTSLVTMNSVLNKVIISTTRRVNYWVSWAI